MAWAKVKIFYSHVLANLAATTTATGYAVANILDWKEDSWWLANNTTTPMYITITSGPGGGSSLTADYLFICGHNLSTIAATVTLQKSATGAWAGEEVDVATKTPANDKAFAVVFASNAELYWRLKITGTLSAAPYLAICVWGQLVELDYVMSSFDPYAENMNADVKISTGGVVSGIHVKHSVRKMDLSFSASNDAFYQKVKTLWENHGLKNFGLGWEITEHGDDVYLMRLMPKFDNPFIKGGLYRDVSLDMEGRKE